MDDVLRNFEPYLSNIDVSAPAAEDGALSKLLEKFIDDVAPLETREQQLVRHRLLEDLRDMLNDWVISKLEEKHIVQDREENELAGKVFVSGSYRLGVNTQGSDIDVICVVPMSLSREEFFSEEDGFIKLLRGRGEVTYVNPVLGARVPIVEVVWSGIELDVLCAIIQRPRVPQNPVDLLDDQILIGMDEASRFTVNGPRVTELIIGLVPQTEPFKLVLRVIRHWAKKRGLYSNKTGFLGGVNWAILVAFICQLYPTATPSVLLHNFFETYKVWKWPTEIRLCHPYEVDGLDFDQWEVHRAGGELMPIITPAYPCMNSSYNVSKYTLRIMTEEFARGQRICKNLLDANRKSPIEDLSAWAALVEPSEFFVKYGSYVVVKTIASDEDKLNRWSGWVESRIRKYLDELDRHAMDQIYPFPKRFEHKSIENIPFEEEKNKTTKDVEEEKKETEKEERKHAVYWYIGIRPHVVNSLRNVDSRKAIDLTTATATWIRGVNMWSAKEEDMDVQVIFSKWRQLPDDEEVFPEGKAAAREIHRKWMNRIKKQNGVLVQNTRNSQRSESKPTSSGDIVDENGIEEEISNNTTKTNTTTTSTADLKTESGNSTNIETIQNALGKRARDEKSASEAKAVMKQAKQISGNNFLQLPRVQGIRTNQPIIILQQRRNKKQVGS